VSGPFRAVWNFAHQSTDWYLNIFRRFIPPIGMFDLSPIVALLVLYILRNLTLALLSGF
jgi:YggT family protein